MIAKAQTDELKTDDQTRISHLLGVFLTTNHNPLTTVLGGPNQTKNNLLSQFWCKLHLTHSESTQVPQNPLRFFAIFCDFCAQNGPISTQSRPLKSRFTHSLAELGM
jgi:hypothetical protein